MAKTLILERIIQVARTEVAEALRYVEEGHAKGKVVITVEHENET